MALLSRPASFSAFRQFSWISSFLVDEKKNFRGAVCFSLNRMLDKTIFSQTVIELKTETSWNVLTIPFITLWYGGAEVMSSPKKKICPSVGGKKPESRLKKVVFPDPLGPMMPAASPSLIANVTLFSAMRPPKCLLNPSTVRISDIPIFLIALQSERLGGSSLYEQDGKHLFRF